MVDRERQSLQFLAKGIDGSIYEYVVVNGSDVSGGMTMASQLEVVLFEVQKRLERKGHLQNLMKDWDRKIGFKLEDCTRDCCLVFGNGKIIVTEWNAKQKVDVVVKGEIQSLQMLLTGDELSYRYAKGNIEMKGHVRDQLKLDSLLRLSLGNEQKLA
ncbi:hypothetical protein MHL86_20455 [Brevibacillus laterosporus]|nr:hypothetical protein [Brevibacillus laterosporus]